MAKLQIAVFSALVAFGLVGIVLSCLLSRQVPFVTSGPGQWIMYPTEIALEARVCDLDEPLRTTFTRRLVIGKPGRVSVHLRAFREAVLYVNEKQVKANFPPNWKRTAVVNISG